MLRVLVLSPRNSLALLLGPSSPQPACPALPHMPLPPADAPPIRRVRLYEPDNDRVIERKPGFFTVRGRKA